jgi:hypothetical protein
VTTFVEIPLPDGGSLIVEQSVDEYPDGVARAGRLSDVTALTTETFESALTRLRSAAEAVNARMRDLSTAPSEVTVEFSVKLGSSIGVVIANSSAEANLKVTLRWNQP